MYQLILSLLSETRGLFHTCLDTSDALNQDSVAKEVAPSFKLGPTISIISYLHRMRTYVYFHYAYA